MNTQIAVQTAFGITKNANVGDCIGQGTAVAGLISAANLDLGLQKYFNPIDSNNPCKNVMYHGNVRIQPLSYQDDVGTTCANAEMAQLHANKLSKMLKEKTLRAHPDKSGVLLLGSEEYKEKIRQDLKENAI